MVIIHHVIDDSVLVRLALTKSPCSDVVDIWLRWENIRAIFTAIYANAPKLKGARPE
jgi:hypothetical protein